MEVWRHGDMDMETWSYEDKETWEHRYGDMDLETWTYGDMATEIRTW